MSRADIIKKLTVALSLAALFPSAVLAAASSTSYNPLEAKDAYPRYGLDEPAQNAESATSITAANVAYFLHERSKLPVGFESKRYQRGEKPRRFDYVVNNLTIHQALDLLVRLDPDYRWQASSGVINISPRESILDFHISSVSIKGSDLFESAEVLFRQVDRPEFTEALRALKGREDSNYYRPGLRRIHLNMVMCTLRDCLNEIVRQDGIHDWTLYYHYSKEGDVRRLEIVFYPRQTGLGVASRKTAAVRNKEFEEKNLRDGFRKTKNGTWVK